jgi:hypothetical protein
MEKHEETRYEANSKRLLNVFKLQLVQEIEGTAYRYRSGKEVWYSK